MTSSVGRRIEIDAAAIIDAARPHSKEHGADSRGVNLEFRHRDPHCHRSRLHGLRPVHHEGLALDPHVVAVEGAAKKPRPPPTAPEGLPPRGAPLSRRGACGGGPGEYALAAA